MCALPYPHHRQEEENRKLTLEEVMSGLLGDGLITPQQCERLAYMAQQIRPEGKHPLTIIAEQNWLSNSQPAVSLDLERLTRWLADRVHLPYLRIDPLKVDVGAVTSIVPHAYASRFGILPVAVQGKTVTIATAEPYVREWEWEISEVLRFDLQRVIANPLAIQRYLDEFYQVSRSISGAASDQALTAQGHVGNLEQLVEVGKTGEPDANDQHVVRIVDWLLQYAFEQRASDIHLEPRRLHSNVRFRIDGILHLVHQIPTPVLAAVVSRIKALGRMDVVEKRRPQDGRIKTKSSLGKEVELRLSTMPTAFGEKLVMRIFDPEVLVRSFADLGFSSHDQRLWDKMVTHDYGMIIVTGPTGSGKTTTLYSTLKQLARPEYNVCTIEDPIEQVDPHLNQMHVQHNIGLTFATGVRTLLRQDPDIIMVGEIRDQETAEAAIQAALTGHLLLSTLHTNDAPSVVTRLLDLGVPPYLIKASLLGAVAQRLVRVLCPFCKVPVEIDPDEWAALVSPLRLQRPVKAFGVKGCDECRHTGYLGRIGIYEIMVMSEGLRKLITADADISQIRQLAIKEGMRPLRISGAQKVQKGITTPAEIFNLVQREGE
jgi:general secretion pathway protein E